MALLPSNFATSASAEPKRIKFGHKALQARPRHLKLPDLPFEIKRMIFSELDAIDQTCLGLACNDLANVLATVNLNLDGNVWWIWDRLKLMRRLKDWMAPKYRFCDSCYKYRPKARDSWNDMATSFAKAYPNTYPQWVIQRWMQVRGSAPCPECRFAKITG